MTKIAKELRQKGVKDLEKESQKILEEIAKLKLESKVKPEKDTNTIIKKRKRLAILLTVLTEKRAIEVADQK